MSAHITADTCVIDAAETYFAEVETIVEDITMTRTLPTLDEIDDLIARLVGVRAVVAGDFMPAGHEAQQGLRRMLEARRGDVAVLLDADRAEQAAGRNTCVEPVADRIAAYEHELSGLDEALARLASYQHLRTVRLSTAAVLLGRRDDMEVGVRTGEWSPTVRAFADDPDNEEKIREVIALVEAEFASAAAA